MSTRSVHSCEYSDLMLVAHLTASPLTLHSEINKIIREDVDDILKLRMVRGLTHSVCILTDINPSPLK